MISNFDFNLMKDTFWFFTVIISKTRISFEHLVHSESKTFPPPPSLYLKTTLICSSVGGRGLLLLSWGAKISISSDTLTIKVKSHQVTKRFPHGSRYLQKTYGGFWSYGPIIIFEIFSDLKWILKMTSKFVFSQFA